MTDPKLKSLVEDAIAILHGVKGDDPSADMAALRALVPDPHAHSLRHDLAFAARDEIYRRRTPCWVYFAAVADLDIVKIGRSTKVPERMDALTRQHGEKHTVIGTVMGDYKEEWFAQRRFKRFRLKGTRYREYFSLSPIAAEIDALIKGGVIPLTVARHG